MALPWHMAPRLLERKKLFASSCPAEDILVAFERPRAEP